MKAGKVVLKIIIIFIAIAVIAGILSYANHNYQLKKEDDLFTPLGELVEVNGNNMSIYTEGTGDDTMVFMSGGGTCSPILDFKSLYSRLSDNYRIVVIEKFGYGFSDVVDKNRDIDNILSDSREALSKAGINGPYILCPHSMSGIEAIYWAEKYPEEVKAIIGLDMAVPDAYLDYKINIPLVKITSTVANLGMTRLIPGAAESDAIKYGTLNEDEKEIYRSIFYRRTATKTMINEVEKVKDNAMKVKEEDNLDIPMLMFCSNGEGTGWEEDAWRKYQYDYISNNENRKLINLNCNHYIHDHEDKRIAEEIKSFVK